MQKIGWAYDLKTATPEMIMRKVKRTGDGTHPLWSASQKMEREDEMFD